MKSKNDFTGRPSEAHDVLDPPATGRGVIGGQRLSGLNEALALLVLSILLFFTIQPPGQQEWKVQNGEGNECDDL